MVNEHTKLEENLQGTGIGHTVLYGFEFRQLKYSYPKSEHIKDWISNESVLGKLEIVSLNIKWETRLRRFGHDKKYK